MPISKYIQTAGAKVLTQVPKKVGPTGAYVLFQRPSLLTEAERLGIPKGERYLFNHTNEILNNAKNFAEKYGYTTPTTVEEAKNMYRQHNTVFRSVMSDLPEEELGKEIFSLNTTDQAKFLASHGYPLSMRDYLPEHSGQYKDDYVFVSPTRESNAGYTGGRMVQVQLQRPFSFGEPSK